MKRRGPRFAAVVVGMVLACSACVCALNPTLDVSQYAHTSWKIREGFAKGQINSIAQTPDGYLWLGTEFGLLRFDGVRAVPWQPPEGRRLPDDFIRSLLVSRDGTLWIGTIKGLVSWKDGVLTDYPEFAGQIIGPLLQDHEGTIWVSVMAFPPPGKLCAIRSGSGSAQCDGAGGALSYGPSGLYEDSKGNLWAGVKDGLWRWKPDPAQFYSMPNEPSAINCFAEGGDGTLLIGTHTGIKRFVDGRAVEAPGTVASQRGQIYRLLRDRDGGLWIGTTSVGRGIVHMHEGRTDVFAQSDGLSGDSIDALFEDREGNIWVSTVNGLDRFREFAVPTFTVNQGLSHGTVGSVLAAKDGSVWLSINGGLNRVRNGQITVYGKPSAQGKLNGQSPRALFQDSHGRIWASTSREFGYLENDEFTPIHRLPGGMVNSIAEDTAGALWVANQDHGLFHLLRSGEVQQIPWAGVAKDDIAIALIGDPLKGGLWLGFLKGGIAYLADGKVRTAYSAADGWGNGFLFRLQVDRDGTLWAATQGGLSRLKNGRIVTLTRKNGLPCDSVQWVIEDDDHSFWLYTACGLVRIARSEMDAWIAAVEKDGETKRRIETTVFDNSDGVRSVALAFLSAPVAKSRDGKLWFWSLDGVSVIDPLHLRVNKLPPPVHIEQITADHKTYEATSNLHLPPLVRDLAIDYTALSLAAPEKVHFRFKLEGQDRDWREVINERRVEYSNLGPGNYRFRVMASNNSGVWNEEGTALDFFIEPAYYQTNRFRALCVLVFLALLWGLHRLRVHQLAREFKAALDARVVERTRIAQELHDTLLQGFLSASMQLDVANDQLPESSPAKPIVTRVLKLMQSVVEEGRGAVRGLRAASDPTIDLDQSLSRIPEELKLEQQVKFKVVVKGHSRPLRPLIRDDVYRIGREAVVNAFRHSQASNIEVELEYRDSELGVVVRDDGCGIDPEILPAGRDGHFGMTGMRERARRIGAKLKVWSRVGDGTEVELWVPQQVAFESQSTSGTSKWLSKLTGRRSQAEGTNGDQQESAR